MAAELDDLDSFRKKLKRLPHANLLRDLNKYQNEVKDLENQISEMIGKNFDSARQKSVLKKDRLKLGILALKQEIERRKIQIS